MESSTTVIERIQGEQGWSNDTLLILLKDAFEDLVGAGKLTVEDVETILESRSL